MGTHSTDEWTPRDAANWAANVDRLHVDDTHRGFAYNLEGKRIAGAQQGFGRLWDRVFIRTAGSRKAGS